jgi:hypothetical protein
MYLESQNIWYATALSIAVLGLLFVVYKVMFKKRYKLASSLLTASEMQFNHYLKRVLPSGAMLLYKVRIADILVAKNTKKATGKLSKDLIGVACKHVDFLVVDEKTLKPLLAIELDDETHNSKKTKKRDAFVEKAYISAKLSVLRVKNRGSKPYPTSEISEILSEVVHSAVATSSGMAGSKNLPKLFRV